MEVWKIVLIFVSLSIALLNLGMFIMVCKEEIELDREKVKALLKTLVKH